MKSGFVSIVGRPNTGKSTLINSIIKEHIAIVSDVAGTTDSGDNTGDNGDAAGDKGNPGTGVALAVVPAVLAGAAIVVAKKRK